MKPPAARLKRTPPEQSGPVRNPIAPQPRVASATNAPETGAPKTSAARDPITAAGAVVCGALENGVRTAYSVIDEYMRRGQDTARSIFNDPKMRGNMSDDRGNFPGGFNSSNPMAMLTEQWMTAMRPWTQAWAAMLPTVMQQPGMNPFAGVGTPTASPTASPTVSLKISSTSPVEVTANLYPGLDMAGLVAEPLLADGAPGKPIEPVEIVRETGGVRVSIKVADKQPAGRYRGLIRRKADGSVVGDLTVIVA